MSKILWIHIFFGFRNISDNPVIFFFNRVNFERQLAFEKKQLFLGHCVDPDSFGLVF